MELELRLSQALTLTNTFIFYESRFLYIFNRKRVQCCGLERVWVRWEDVSENPKTTFTIKKSINADLFIDRSAALYTEDTRIRVATNDLKGKNFQKWKCFYQVPVWTWLDPTREIPGHNKLWRRYFFNKPYQIFIDQMVKNWRIQDFWVKFSRPGSGWHDSSNKKLPFPTRVKNFLSPGPIIWFLREILIGAYI